MNGCGSNSWAEASLAPRSPVHLLGLSSLPVKECGSRPVIPSEAPHSSSSSSSVNSLESRSLEHTVWVTLLRSFILTRTFQIRGLEIICLCRGQQMGSIQTQLGSRISRSSTIPLSLVKTACTLKFAAVNVTQNCLPLTYKSQASESHHTRILLILGSFCPHSPELPHVLIHCRV